MVERPNVLLLIGDDHGYPYFGFTGSEIVQTPQLDLLAEEGVVFTRAYSTSNVCRPALWTLLTGLYPHQMHALVAKRTGTRFTPGRAGIAQWRDADLAYVEAIRSDPDTLPRAFARAGYATFQSGKYWEGSYRTAGFAEGMTRGAGRDAWNQLGGEGISIGRPSLKPVLDFIDSNQEQPFFVWYAPMLPHWPYNAPDRLREPYERTGVSPAAAEYYANCSWFDESVGELLEHLGRRGLRDRTLVVYVSDNGFQMESDANYGHAHGGPQGKLSTHEQSFHTPIILNYPGRIEAGRVDESLVSSADLYPTLLDYAGAQGSSRALGTSLRPRLEDRATETREHLIGSTTFVRVSESELRADASAPEPGDPWELLNREAIFHLVSEDWHYLHNQTRDERALYDVGDASPEPRNVVASHKELVGDYADRIEAWKAELLRSVGSSEVDGSRP